MKTPKVVIVVEGGEVKNVLSDCAVEVLLLDHDRAATGDDGAAEELAVERDALRVRTIWEDPEQCFG